MKKIFGKTIRGLIRSIEMIALVIGFIAIQWMAVLMKLIAKALVVVIELIVKINSTLCGKMKKEINSFAKFNL